MLHSLSVLQLPMECDTTSQWNVVQLPIGMQILLLYTLTHNALSHTKYKLSIVGEMLGQCSSTIPTYNVLAIYNQ